MTQNNLSLRRLIIYTNNGTIAYDEKFHEGINIICGDNSSGKSTITHFIFFVLGGDFNDFVPQARECDVVYAELKINDTVFTIKRYIQISEQTKKINSKIGIHFYWGNYEESKNPPPNKHWVKYQYNTTDKKKSFSNVFFELLNLPEVKEENNITMHQILRLLYIDQESPTSSLFYYDDFDKQNKREAVADLLLGIYSQELYDFKLELYNKKKELEEVKNEINVTKKFFPDKFLLNNEHINSLIRDKEEEIKSIGEEIIKLRNSVGKTEFNKKTKFQYQELQEKIINKRNDVIDLKNSYVLLENEIIDSEYFIETLEDKFNSIEKSIKTRQFLGSIPIEYCPSCLSKLVDTDEESSCKLCKQKTEDKFGITQANRMKLEIKFQIDESSKLLSLKNKRFKKLEIKLQLKEKELRSLQGNLNESIKDVKPFELEKIDSLNFKKGLAEGEIMQFRTLLEQAEKYQELIDSRESLRKRIAVLDGFISTIKRKQLKTKKAVIGRIQKEGVFLLNNDLERQREFSVAKSKDFIVDFSNNLVYLKSKDIETFKSYQKFSASSNFYLKISARFAIFLASLKENQMRFPRFIFADNMEDKGIEERRAQNLQEILISRFEEKENSNSQLIYTTSYLSKKLRKSKYIVGQYHTKENPSLKF
ncbi:AAA domain-containing protein [Tenacibaculum maritimum]|nr:AAA domain-containing protein [Tenacibaculum maritimum]